MGCRGAASFSILVGSSLWCNPEPGTSPVPVLAGFSILVGSSLWCNRAPPAGLPAARPRFSILVGSSLWCNCAASGGPGGGAQVSVSSSDRASGATRPARRPASRQSSVSVSSSDRASGATRFCQGLLGFVKRVSVSSSDRASGATHSDPPQNLAWAAFQYPRRIEPLVQLVV